MQLQVEMVTFTPINRFLRRQNQIIYQCRRHLSKMNMEQLGLQQARCTLSYPLCAWTASVCTKIWIVSREEPNWDKSPAVNWAAQCLRTRRILAKMAQTTVTNSRGIRQRCAIHTDFNPSWPSRSVGTSQVCHSCPYWVIWCSYLTTKTRAPPSMFIQRCRRQTSDSRQPLRFWHWSRKMTTWHAISMTTWRTWWGSRRSTRVELVRVRCKNPRLKRNSVWIRQVQALMLQSRRHLSALHLRDRWCLFSKPGQTRRISPTLKTAWSSSSDRNNILWMANFWPQKVAR